MLAHLATRRDPFPRSPACAMPPTARRSKRPWGKQAIATAKAIAPTRHSTPGWKAELDAVTEFRTSRSFASVISWAS